ncbi:MAG: CoA transferase [Dehalococcoidia bacterium]|nr:CoA transferase [Dehalococcoidia bacterium]
MEDTNKGLLSLYRVLDLTDEKGVFCGKLLGDLGADVIKIEPPGGDPVRNLGPFYHDEPHPEKSLFWFAFNTNKRGITLDIRSADGREILKKLVKTADFVLESFPPGYMDSIGLGYSSLEKINPRVIMVSISPFGQTGPHRDYKDSGIVTWAMCGFMGARGDADRAPIQISHHAQTFVAAGIEGGVGAMMALYDRWSTGEGQHVDVSIQEAGGRGVPPVGWVLMKIKGRRELRIGGAGLATKYLWPCKDGMVMWFYAAGSQGSRRSSPLVEWMQEEGFADEYLKGIDWDKLDMRQAGQEAVDRMAEPTARFFMSHTKAELFDGAVKRRLLLYPVSTTRDILESPQLAARGFWRQVKHPELDVELTYPGPFANVVGQPLGISRRAPLIGEHNEEVYEKELGITREEILTLKQAGVL